VITDLYMPKTDGIETLQRIRNVAPKLPVIGLSELGCDDPCAKAMLLLGAFEVLSKPVDLRLLLAVLQRALSRRMAS
jgi:DNA-binding NtrC family response regulator